MGTNTIKTDSVTDKKEKRRVVVFLPCAGVSFPPEFVESYLKARTFFQHTMSDHELVEWFPRFTPNIGALRSMCAAYMVEGFRLYKPDTSIWLDIDHDLPHDILVKLLSHKEPVVLGMYFLKSAPFNPIVYRKGPYDRVAKHHLQMPVLDYPQEGLFEVDNAGMGCAKIDREVFLKLKPPFFHYRTHSMLESGDYTEMMVKYKIDNNTEDFPFWDQVKEVGYKIWVDPTIKLGHIGQKIYTEEHWLHHKVANKLGDMAD
jgi:hypothetical protein